MSGGFFRGTSFEQDTRFSNKQAKLMKSQKFPPELEHLVDMTKVKMDVVKPWIATRVTEFLGFEDEVLINFIYGLLDAKEVNGKEVQIQLTGFMEKNTGKFMKELWSLLLSAQKNASGVPQQLLDAKEEETRLKLAERDRITAEILKEKENIDSELTRQRKMDGGAETKANNASMDPSSKQIQLKGSSGGPGDEKETEIRNGSRGRSRLSRSPHSSDHSPSSPRHSPSRIRRSLSNSRSYSGERQKPRSISRSPDGRDRSVSPDRRRKRSFSPQRRRSPRLPGRSSYARQRSRSPSSSRSPSPVRRRLRSPYRRRSPSPIRRRRSPSPIRRRRSPTPIRRRRSPSPIRRRRSPSPPRRRNRSRSPVRRRRSPSPIRQRRSPAPTRRRRSPSPVRRRRSPSPQRRRSPSPQKRRSPSPVRRRYERSPSTSIHGSPSPVRCKSLSPARKTSPVPTRRRSPSPSDSRSSSPIRQRSPSPTSRRSAVQSSREKPRSREISSPVRSQRSGARNVKERKDLSRRVPAVLSSPERSPVQSGSPPPVKKRSNNDDKSPARKVKGRDNSLSPPQPKEQRSRYESSDTSKDGEENGRPHVSKLKDSPAKAQYKGKQSLETGVGHQTTESRSQSRLDQGKREQESRSEKLSGRKDHSREGSEGQKSPVLNQTDAQKPVVGRHSHGNTAKDDRRPKTDTITSSGKADHSNGGNKHDSDSDRSGKHIIEGKEKRKHKRSHRHETSSDDDYSHDSEIEEKKESKKRRKEEKKLRKEEKRRRREERRRKREERRAEKLKRKDQDETSSSDDDHVEKKRKSHQSDDEKDDSEQRKLEIELRKKALESLKAKKGIDH
ncbi:Serine/arginine repetitive matrix protein 1 [Linum perenne]